MSASRSLVMNRQRIQYTVRVSRTARKARIRVNPAGVEVIVPADADEGRAEALLRENAHWVVEQLAFVERMGSIRVTRDPLPADSILFQGRPTRIEVVPDESRRHFSRVVEEAGCLRLLVPDTGRDPSRSLEAWLRRRARVEIETRLAERSREMRRRPGRLYVMGQRTKWGGCSGRRNLSFNWRLVMAPPAVLDYIVVHELAHLVEPNHSARFWLIVRSYCADYERQREWLREHESQLRLPTIRRGTPLAVSGV